MIDDGGSYGLRELVLRNHRGNVTFKINTCLTRKPLPEGGRRASNRQAELSLGSTRRGAALLRGAGSVGKMQAWGKDEAFSLLPGCSKYLCAEKYFESVRLYILRLLSLLIESSSSSHSLPLQSPFPLFTQWEGRNEKGS